MKEDYSSSDFPVHIDLGKEPQNSPMEAASSDRPSPKKYYPSLYLSDIPGISSLPRKGWALIEFEAPRVNLEISEDGNRASADLKIKTICLPDSSDDDGEDMATILAKALKGAGHEVDVDVEDEEEGEE